MTQQSVFGLYSGSLFACNCRGGDMPTGGGRSDFLRLHVSTIRDIIGGRVTTARFGGLTDPLEHRLYPSTPSRNIRRSRPIVRAFCLVRDNNYCATGLVDSDGWVFRCGRDVQLGQSG